MFEKKDYSKLTLEELLVEEKATQKKASAYKIIAGVAVGVTLYAIYRHTNGFIHVLILLLSPFILHRNGENLKKIQAEIKNRDVK